MSNPPKDFLSTSTWSQLHCLETNMAGVRTLCENALYTRCFNTRHEHFITRTFALRAGVDRHIHANAILSSPFWCWFRTRANAWSVSCITCYTAWLPWKPLAPLSVHYKSVVEINVRNDFNTCYLSSIHIVNFEKKKLKKESPSQRFFLVTQWSSPTGGEERCVTRCVTRKDRR